MLGVLLPPFSGEKSRHYTLVCLHACVCAVEPVKCGTVILLQIDMSAVQCKTMRVIPSQSDERGSAAAAVAADMWQPPGSQNPCMMISTSAKCIPW